MLVGRAGSPRARPTVGAPVMVAVQPAAAPSGARGGACSSSSAEDITCSEFAELDSDDRMGVVYDMLDEHDLAKPDPGNLAGISSAIVSYCGAGASKHPDEPINNAVDWESDTR